MLGRIGFLIRNPCPRINSDEKPEKCGGLGSDRKFFRKPSLYPLSYRSKDCFFREKRTFARNHRSKRRSLTRIGNIPADQTLSRLGALLLFGSLSFQLRSDPLIDLRLPLV